MVEARGRRSDALEREERRHLGERHALAVLARRPAEEREEVHERLRQEALRLELLHAGGAVPLAELLAVRAEDHPEVREDGAGRAERAEQRDVLRRVRKVVHAAHRRA